MCIALSRDFLSSPKSTKTHSSLYYCSHVAVNACLTPVCAVHGAAVTTVEGIGSVEAGLHPVQVCQPGKYLITLFVYV